MREYFLPVARKITVEPGSVVLLHGSIDEGFPVQAGGVPAKSRETYEAQMDYARRHAIPRGWLMMRDAEDVWSKFTAGELATPFINPPM